VTPPRLEVSEDESQVAETVARALHARLLEPGDHHIVLTGGGVGTDVLAELALTADLIDWTRVHLWWGDERFLPSGHPERNETGARKALIDHIPIPDDHVHPMPADVGQGADAASVEYADELARASQDGQLPDFDILLLGMGPDGHVASLFPGAPALTSDHTVVGVHDAPKPPPTRVSMTLTSIRRAASVWIVAAGSAKAPAVQAMLDSATTPSEIPAVGARGRRETVVWIDRAAGQGRESGPA
jgi:6-phosphogluconolactonase